MVPESGEALFWREDLPYRAVNLPYRAKNVARRGKIFFLYLVPGEPTIKSYCFLIKWHALTINISPTEYDQIFLFRQVDEK